MSKYQTLVILADGLALHPRKVTIEGKEYTVTASAEGHGIAEMEPYEALATELRLGQHEALDADDLATLAEEVQRRAIRQRESSYDE
jgi:hypothetical protein